MEQLDPLAFHVSHFGCCNTIKMKNDQMATAKGVLEKFDIYI